MMPQNIAERLSSMAASQPDRLAILFPNDFSRRGRLRPCTFRELDDRSAALARQLAAIGIGPGVRTVLMVPPSLEFFCLTFALFKAGAVPVFVDPGMGVRNLGRCLEEAEPAAFIGIGKAHAARLLLGWARRSVRTLVHTPLSGPGWWSRLGEVLMSRLPIGACRLKDPPNPAPRLAAQYWTSAHSASGQESIATTDQPHEPPAAILFTSGSTGVPKGVVYTHQIFSQQVELLRRTYAIEPGEIDLCTFPLFALFAPALGMTAIIPDMDPSRPARAAPERIIQAITEFGATNLFGSPALIDRLGRFGQPRGIKLPSLRRVISAGAPVHADVLERLGQLLTGGAQIHTPYGATEALPVSTIGSREIVSETRWRTAEGAGVCVGRPVDGMRLAIIGTTDDPIAVWDESLVLPAGQLGEICVQGPVVTACYWSRPRATRLAKIPDPLHGTFYHRMGDLGYLDTQGRLWFCGRKSQRVVTSSGTLATVACEGIFNMHPLVRRTALVGVSRQGGVEPVLCVEFEPHGSRRDRVGVETELLELGAARPMTRSIRTILFHPSFPVDVRHNAKIGREALAEWATRRLASRG